MVAISFLTLLLFLPVLEINPRVALASCHRAKEQIYVKAQNNGSDPLRIGTRSRILMRNRDLDQTCPPTGVPRDDGGWTGAATLSTAHIRPGLVTSSDRSKFVEIGWVEVWRDSDTSSQAPSRKRWYVFSEKQANWNVTDVTLQHAPNLEPGNEDLWRIRLRDNGSGWKLSVNFIIGQGWVLFKEYNTNWDRGVPIAETERFTGGTGMADTQDVLLWQRPGDGQWVVWKDNRCWKHEDNIPGQWSYDHQGPNSYGINHSGIFC